LEESSEDVIVGSSGDHKEKFYCSEVMVHFSALCFSFWLHTSIKNQAFGCLLPEVCLSSAVSVLQGRSSDMFK